jgi:hypothetical protein
MNVQIMDREQAREFLDSLEARLRLRLRQAERDEGKSIPQQVIQIQKEAAASKDKARAHLKQPEAAFLNTWVAPAINAALVAAGSSPSEASDLLLAESYKALSDISAGPAARPIAFPFEKRMRVSERAIYDRWARKKDEQPFKQPYPDLAIRAPYGIVFEGKYFRSGSRDYAERQLVAAIHEALFYLGVPEVEARGRAWSYRYACLVAFDASNDGALLAAWNGLKNVRQKFWECANLKVIVIGQQEMAG